jgi:hypothetical protein
MEDKWSKLDETFMEMRKNNEFFDNEKFKSRSLRRKKDDDTDKFNSLTATTQHSKIMIKRKTEDIRI